MNKRYRIFSLDFPKMNKNPPKLRLKTQNQVFQKQNCTRGKEVMHCDNSKVKEYQVNFKRLEFKGKQFNHRQSYSGSLAISLASRVKKVKNVLSLSKMTAKPKQPQLLGSENTHNFLVGSKIGGRKPSLESIHRQSPAAAPKVSIPAIDKHKKKSLLKIDHYTQKIV